MPGTYVAERELMPVIKVHEQKMQEKHWDEIQQKM